MAMVRKAFAAAIAILFVTLLLLVETSFIEVTNANPIGGYMKPAYESFQILSPNNGSTCDGQVRLYFTINTNAPSDMHNNYVYKIDETKAASVDNVTLIRGTEISNEVSPYSISAMNPWHPYYMPYVDYLLQGYVVLPPLLKGWHTIYVNRGTSIGDRNVVSPSVTIYFDTRLDVSVQEPQNQTYRTNNIELSFAAKNDNLSVFYSVDAKDNVTVAGNTTMMGLSEGFHTLEVYAIDTAGNTEKSDTIFFAVELPTPSPSPTPSPLSPTLAPTDSPTVTPSPSPTIEPSPTPTKREDDFAPLAIAAGLVIAVAVVIALIYVAKRRGKKTWIRKRS